MNNRKTRVPLFAANWKMNHGPLDAQSFMQDFVMRYPERNDRRIIFFPPALSVAAVVAARNARSDIRVGVQNIYFKENGAFTGEISASLALQAGAEYCLVGHSERRELFEETDDTARLKCRAALAAGLSPILCLGESRHDRLEGRTIDVVGRQLRAVVNGLDTVQSAAIAIAYEPLWAIGTGENATPGDASEVHRHIRFLLRQSLGATAADNIAILYGGSVNPGNAAELLAAGDVDGLLVGGASLSVDSWLAIVSA
jgi:triosephosphate isomerase